MQIYVSKDGQLFGPYSEENYKKYLDSSVFSDEHLICVDGTNWVPPFEVFSGQKNKLEKPTPKTKNLGALKKHNLGKKIKYVIFVFLFISLVVSFCLSLFLQFIISLVR